jgi:tetratricopeptide (TPR) repeat protein
VSGAPGGPRVGGSVGPYRLDAALGSGGNATVFRARGPDGAAVAVKVLHPHSVGTEHAKRFTREYRALARLDHPNIVRVIQAGVDDGYPWIAMELVEGRDLDAELAAWATADPADRFTRAEQILRGLCAALVHVHERGLIHRDLKPANVLIDPEGRPRLSDFGVVKDQGSNATALTRHGNLVGTIAFMAPEQITDEPVDPRTDLYSLGAILYVMLTDHKPIEADSITGFLARHLTHVPPAPSALRPDVPRRLEAICERLLYKDRSQRFPSAAAVLAALDARTDPDEDPLRGRDTTLAALRDRLSALHDGVGGVVAVVGPEGSGRTSVLRALARLAEEAGVAVAMADGAGPNPVTAALRALDADAAQEPTAQHLRALAERLRGRPTVLILDDLDRANPKILDATGRLVHKLVAVEVEPLLLVFGARLGSAAAAALMDGESTGIPAEIHELGGLAREDLLLALRDRGLRGTTASALARRFLDELGGLPGAVDRQLAALLGAGWIRRDDGRLVAALPMGELHRRPLPVPPAMRAAIEERLAALQPDGLALAEALAVFGRPTAVEPLLAAARAPRGALDDLRDGGLIEWIDEDGARSVRFAQPWAAATVFAAIHPVRRQGIHGAVADALTAQSGLAGLAEQARHREAAGQPSAAYPLLARAARLASREHRHALVLELTEHALRLAPAAERALPSEQAIELRGRLSLMRGEALLARGAWDEAREPLEQALAAARLAGTPATVGRAAAGLGRAWYHRERYDEAAPLLTEALALTPEPSADRAYALRALADLHLRRGELDQAEALWQQALDRATALDAEARARRGLANLRVLQNRLVEASEQLDRADSQLRAGGAARVRVAVLARLIELDLAAARFATAQRRSEELVDLAEREELESCLAEAWITRVEVLVRTAPGAAVSAALDKAATWVRLDPPRAGLLRIRFARSLAILRRFDQALAVLPDPLALDADPIEDPAGQHGALRALASAARHPSRAVELAHWCLRRPPPRLRLRHFALLVDAGEALRLAGDIAGPRAVAKRGLAALDAEGYDGPRLELLALFARVDPDPRIRDALDRVLERIRTDQPPAIADALAARFSEAGG